MDPLRPAFQVELEGTTDDKEAEKTLEITFYANVLNAGEVVARDVSVVLFVPREFIHPYPTHDLSWLYRGVEYSSVSKNCEQPIYPLTRQLVIFDEQLHISNAPLPAQQFTVLCKVFDEYGPALTSTIRVQLPHAETQVLKEIHAEGRAPSPLAKGSLE